MRIGSLAGLRARRPFRGVSGGAAAAAPLFAAKLYSRHLAPAISGAVAQLDDVSGADRHFPQATAANRPTAQISPTNRRQVRFDGAASPNNDHLALPSAYSIPSRNFTIIIARRALANNGASQAFLHQPAGATSLGFYVNAGSVAPGAFRIFDNGTTRTSTIFGGHSVEVICFRGDAAGCRITHGRETWAGPLLANLAPVGGWFGAWNSGGNPTTFPLNGDLFEIRVYLGLTLAEEEQAVDQVAAEHGALTRSADLFQLFEGDSLTFWGLANSPTSPDDCFPEQAYQQQGTLKGRMKYVNSGSGGMRLGASGEVSTMLATNQPEFLGALFTQNVNYPKHGAYLLAGINDVHGGATLAQMESRYQEWITRLRSGAGAQGAGIKAGISTIPPNEFQNQAVQAAVNASIRANFAAWGYNYLGDPAADARLQDTNNLVNFEADGTHKKRPGEAIMSEIWHTAAAAAGAL